MRVLDRVCSTVLLLPTFLVAGAAAQQRAATTTRTPERSAPISTGTRQIALDVVVTPKSGAPVGGLTQADFEVLDNRVAQPLTSFRAVTERAGAIQVVLVVDAVNATFSNVAYERTQIDRFLKADGGHLPYPMTLAVVTDAGAKIQQDSTQDGNALSASLGQYETGLRTIRRSTGFYGATERLQISLKAISDLAKLEGTRPGRKMILWVSPGWPLLSGPGVQLGAKEQTGIYGDVVRLSDELRVSGVTLYSIDPLGTADAGGFRTFYYKDFVKGLTKPGDAALGDLGLQVLAEQSGGLALNSSNDVAGLLQRCMEDARWYYEIFYTAPPAERVNEYHGIEVKVRQPGLTARTRQGYYSQP